MSKRKTSLPECIERVDILMTLEAAAYERHKEAIEVLDPSHKDADSGPDDIINVRYKFWVHYHGVVKQLQAVQEICDDPDVITATSCADLEEGRILIYEVLKKLDNIIQQVKERKRPTCFLSRIFKHWFSRPCTLETRDLERQAAAMAKQDILHAKFLRLPWVKALLVKRYEDNLARVPLDGRTLTVTQDQFAEAKKAFAQYQDDVKLLGYTLIPGDN